MARYLVVANQTLGGAALDRAVRERIERGDARFHVVVPMVEPATEVTSWAPQDPLFGMPVPLEATQESMEEAEQRSQHRLRAMVEAITALGGVADGEVGSVDPYTAVEQVLDRESFDEVIVSTLPIGISRWIRMDLPSRIERLAPCPVVTVEADE
jgi:nucleotide-binding universal stress UspA family protein